MSNTTANRPIIVPNRRALGAVLADPDVQERIDRRGWLRRLSMRDYTERLRLMHDIAFVYEGVRCGRRFDLLADDLTVIAHRIEDIPCRWVGGWAISTWRATT